MLKSFFNKWRNPWVLISAVAVVGFLTIFVMLKLRRDVSDRVPAQFSQQELQYAEVLWGDGKEGQAQPENSFPSVQPQWGNEEGSETSYNYSNPLEEDLQQQIQEEYHSRLYEEWRQRKAKEAAEKIKQQEKKISSGKSPAPAKPTTASNPAVNKPK